MSLTPSQIERRLEGITGTDVAAIVGVHPQRSAIDVWQEKRGETPPWVDTDRTRWGTLLEPLLRADYADCYGLRVDTPGTLQHPDNPWMMATPDGVIYVPGGSEPLGGLEIKCHTIRLSHLYGDPGTDEIPLYVLCQAMWGMGVTGLKRWDVRAFIDGVPRDHVVSRDEETIGMLREKSERFLVDNVRGGMPPAPDGSDSYTDWLSRRWAKNADALIDIGDDVDTFSLLERGRELRAYESQIEAELESIGQKLKTKIGDQAGMTWKDEHGKPLKITWKYNKASNVVNHAAMARDAWQGASLASTGLKGDVAFAAAALKSKGLTKEADLVVKLHTELTTIGLRRDAAYTTSVPGARPLVWPKQWNAKKK